MPNTDDMTLDLIGRRLRAERERNDMTLDEAAGELGLSHRSQLSRVERGERGVDSLLLRRAAGLYGVRMEAFFSEPATRQIVVKARKGEAGDEKAQAMADFAQRKLADWQFVMRESNARGL